MDTNKHELEKDFLQVQMEGSRQVERRRKLYNLDTIIMHMKDWVKNGGQNETQV